MKMIVGTPEIPAIEAKSSSKRVEVSNIENKTLVNEVQQLKSTKLKLFKMTEETPKIPAIEAKSPTKRVEVSNGKKKALVNDV